MIVGKSSGLPVEIIRGMINEAAVANDHLERVIEREERDRDYYHRGMTRHVGCFASRALSSGVSGCLLCSEGCASSLFQGQKCRRPKG